MRQNKNKGQVLLLFLVALGLFLLGAIGFTIDASFLFTHRQLAQAAADASVEAAIMSVFNKTNTAGFSNEFGAEPFDCAGGSDQRTPCVYARYHGFGDDPNELVSVSFPGSVPGVTLSADDSPAAISVTVSRTVDTGLVALLGTSLATVRARAIAVITDIFSPVPIIVLHPTFGPGVGGGGPPDAAFEKNGDNTVAICGGPTKSIQVNTNHGQAVRHVGNGAVDLSKAGPKNFLTLNDCAGEGSNFGQFGGPNPYYNPPGLWLGNDGEFIQPSSPISDPLRNVPQPSSVGLPLGGKTPIPGGGVDPDCPLAAGKSCQLYSPGRYASGIQIKNEFAVFQPGLYYMVSGGFQIQANGAAHMGRCVSPNTGDYGCGMMVVNDGNSSKNDIFSIASNSGSSPSLGGPFQYTYPDGNTCLGNCLLGSREGGIYKGILFFEDRTSPYKKHEFQGGGGMTLRGTIYLTNGEDTMRANPGNYQFLSFGGNAGSATRVIGMIIVDRLTLGGTSDIIMTLNPNAALNIRQVALVR